MILYDRFPRSTVISVFYSLWFTLVMSFVMLYQVPRSETNRCFSLRGVVGKDSQLYWSMKDVQRLAPLSDRFRFSSTVRVRDVVGRVAARLGEQTFLRQRVVTHLQACKALRKAKGRAVQLFERQLNSPWTWVHEVVRGSDPAAPWQEPSLIRMLEKEEVVVEKHILFYVWYACFRKRMAEAVYGQKLELSVTELFGGEDEEETKKQGFVFPCSILLRHGEKAVRYVREPV